ncbi:non-ribosomal peptide synthetase [Clostridium sp. BNL1100]|uniref:non-ribosomal peptide synthetase n=1 Tax=Clostridium sp. BNL1100 TaxID=755731 RepID=UPI00024A7A01|nr:non-ribosomal peptide synthetase [Clostridium sp. BNL1100]AEY64861.1 amino acid adenylation enzyme/thioester reductase family protein [Clostridium sp. BNL1100]
MSNANLITLFDKAVEIYRNEPAIIFEGKTITYTELENNINKLAELLIHKNIKKGNYVGVCIRKSPELIYAAMAVLKLGAVYVPLAPEYPVARTDYIIKDAGIDSLIADSDMRNKFNVKNVVCPTEDLSETNVPKIATEIMQQDDLAYAIYTSGTTGKPKGVMIHCGGFLNRIQWQRKYFNVDSKDRVLHKAPIGFDISLWEMFLPLVSGAALVISKENGYMDVEYIINLIESTRVTISQFVPSILRILVEYTNTNGNSKLACLRKIVSSGEELTFGLLKAFTQHYPNIKLYNFYGPTEASICVTACCLNECERKSYVPLGDAIDNMEVFLLDDDNRLITDSHIKGEICIGGIGVGKGYINKPQETEYAFCKHYSREGEVMYRTGDIGYYCDNDLVYVGRKDQTVKIRGNRVDLGEIEVKICEIHQIEAAVVKCFKTEQESQILAAFYKPVNKDSDSLKIQELLAGYLKNELPAYMLPQQYIKVDEFELTSNGKIDREKLKLEEKTSRINENNGFYGDKDKKAIIIELFTKYLNCEISEDDDFFILGGSSLEAIRMIMEINNELNISLKYTDVMLDLTVNGIVNACD